MGIAYQIFSGVLLFVSVGLLSLLIGNVFYQQIIVRVNAIKKEGTTVIEPVEKEKEIRKRIFDVVFSMLIIIFILSWLIPVIGIAIKFSSRGPVFLKQVRVGYLGRTFLSFNFRCMRTAQEVTSGNSKKFFIPGEITPIGSFLIKTGLHQFPNFFNVLRGDMSVVGRSYFSTHLKFLKNLTVSENQILFKMKPGIISLYNLSKDSVTVNPKEFVKFDIFYANNYNLSLDVKIIVAFFTKTLGMTTKYNFHKARTASKVEELIFEDSI
jgi:putative colanic acid biosysnthesis UDP-glucose lipid carrier transferase